MHNRRGRNQIGYSLHRLTSILQRMSEDLLQEQLGIGFSQFKMMHIITKHPAAEQQDLALFLGQTEASVSRQARLMKQMKLINIERDNKDSRKKRATLTNKGQISYQKAKKLLEGMHADTIRKFNDSEVKQFKKYIDGMLEAVGCETD